jgi:hypothetical protein
VGIVTLLAIGAIAGIALLQLVMRRSDVGAGLVIISVQLIYFLTYARNLAQAMLVGLGAPVARGTWSTEPERALAATAL